MLFDLRGKRRRTVQITYVGLAFLMAAGLIGAGVGSGTSGGLFDLFSGGGGGGSAASKQVKKRLAREQVRLRANPADEATLRRFMEDEQLLASQLDYDKKRQTFGKDGRAELRKGAAAWQRYTATNPKKPSLELATRVLQTYILLGDAAGAAQAAEVVAGAGKDWQAYARWSCYASVAHQTRKSTLAGEQAIKIAPKPQQKAAKAYVASGKTATRLTRC
jgi:hypothetical protein